MSSGQEASFHPGNPGADIATQHVPEENAQIVRFPYNPEVVPAITIAGFSEVSVTPQDGSEPITDAEALHGLAFALRLSQAGRYRVETPYIANHPDGYLGIWGVLDHPSGFKSSIKIEIDENRRPMDERAIEWFGRQAVPYDQGDFSKLLGVSSNYSGPSH
jgi:hypothetical protein